MPTLTSPSQSRCCHRKETRATVNIQQTVAVLGAEESHKQRRPSPAPAPQVPFVCFTVEECARLLSAWLMRDRFYFRFWISDCRNKNPVIAPKIFYSFSSPQSKIFSVTSPRLTSHYLLFTVT
jgi:hypothetical protein